MKAKDIANVTTVSEMKEILFKKLQDEETYFKKSDIHIVSIEGGFRIWVNDYEHIKFKMTFEYDEHFGYCVWIYDPSEDDFIEWIDDKNTLDIKTALIHLGYYIGTRF